MTLQYKPIGKYLLIAFYVFVWIITWVEQVDFTNAYGIGLFLSALGIFVTLLWGFNLGLFYSLVAFPLAFEFLYFEVIAPHMPLFLIQLNLNTIIFSSLYGIFLITIYFKKWNSIALFIFLFGIIHVEKNLPTQLYAAFSYRESGSIQSSPIRKALLSISVKENVPIYLICLDGYPDLTSTVYAKYSKADSLLKAFEFHPQKNEAKSLQTPVSIRYLITGKLFPQEFTNLNSPSIGSELYLGLQKIAPMGYGIYLGSVLADYNLAKPFFSVISPIRPNKLLVKPFKRFFSDDQYVGSSEAMATFHNQLISQIDGEPKQLKLLHFITFHGFSTDKREFLHDIPVADKLLTRILDQIKSKSPRSKVIIFSDHGERFTPGLEPRAAILYLNY